MIKKKPTEMQYLPSTAVWEVTLKCNMKCKHCGFPSDDSIPDELTTEEALRLCDEMGALGVKRVSLTGGEVITRHDWTQLVERLAKNNIRTNIVSNGWLLNRETVRKAKAAGITDIAISLDGLETTHDFLRRDGSYKRSMAGLDVLREENVPSSIITCIHKRNMPELSELKEILVKKGVRVWKLQAAVPMGNMLDYPDWLIKPEEIDDIIDFAYDVMKEGKIKVYLTDDIGYFNCKEIEVRKNSIPIERNTGLWDGCSAGKQIFGIRNTGDIVGCLYIRDEFYIEGNIRDTSLEELWTRPGAFAWNREMDKSKLTGFCKTCQFGSYCRGGCSGAKLIRYKSIGENKFCSYRVAVEKEQAEINRVNDFDFLVKEASENIKEEDYQLAELQLQRALQLKPGDTIVLNTLGFVHLHMENFDECESYNRTVLEKDPDNAYSLKNLGVCLSKTGRVEKGIEFLKRAIQSADENFLDPYYDLAVVLKDNDRYPEAIEVLDLARKKSEEFKQMSEEFYRFLNNTV